MGGKMPLDVAAADDMRFTDGAMTCDAELIEGVGVTELTKVRYAVGAGAPTVVV